MWARKLTPRFLAIFVRKHVYTVWLQRRFWKAISDDEIEIEQIGPFKKSLSKDGRIWTWIVYILKLIPNMS